MKNIYIDCLNLNISYGGAGLKRYNKNLLDAILKIKAYKGNKYFSADSLILLKKIK